MVKGEIILTEMLKLASMEEEDGGGYVLCIHEIVTYYCLSNRRKSN